MKLWSSWQRDILPHVAGCPTPIIEHELLRAAQEFFSGSRAWIVTYADQTVLATVAEVSLAPASAEQEIVRLEKVWVNGVPADVLSFQEMDRAYGDDWQTHTGTPTAVIQLSPDSVRLYPIPTDSITLKVRASVQPSEAATGLPDDMAGQYRMDLVEGAKSKLMMYSKSEWYDPKKAAVHESAFQAAIDSANVSAARSFGAARITARKKWC